MAFQLGRQVDIPTDIEGTYLIPVAWLVFGLSQENLSLDKKKFDNSLQGSVYRWWEDNDDKLPLVKNITLPQGKEIEAQLWLVYQGKGLIDYFYYPARHYCNEVQSDRIKSGTLYICGLNYLAKQSSNTQKSINSSLIQLFPGCGVTMHYSSWF